MSRWFRHYAGMMRDDKLVRIAIRTKQSVERVIWVFGAILESAAEIDDNGRFDFDPAEAAYFLRADEADISAIQTALADAGHLASGAVVKWGDRQFISDRSRDRVAAHRERKRGQINKADVTETDESNGVTLQKRHRNSPETELETDTEVTDASASVRAQPQPIAEAITVFNESAVEAGWPCVAKSTPARQALLRSRLREDGIDGWRSAVARARASPFLGSDPPPEFMSFDWLVKPANFAKVIEGNFDHAKRQSTVREINPNSTVASIFRAEAEAEREAGFDYSETRLALPAQFTGRA